MNKYLMQLSEICHNLCIIIFIIIIIEENIDNA
jgi:hypothetical protein